MRTALQFSGMMRRPADYAVQRRTLTKSYPAPTGGWIANRNLAQPTGPGLPPGAAILENWFPTATGVSMRRGSQVYATLGDGDQDVTALFSYKNGNQEELFGATSDTIYNITNIVTPLNILLVDEHGNEIITDTDETIGQSSTAGLEELSGLTGGDWVVVQFETAGGVFLRGVNGQDTPFVYDGATFTDTPAITGVTPETLSYVWAYRNRLFFIEEGSLNAWYLPVDSIGGAAAKFPLGGVFTRGGSLLFGASWSLDSGSGGQGLSDQCIFVSTEGEVAVYQGANPSDPADWSLVGVYRIGRPLGAKAHIRAGGDLVIATDVGFVPLSAAVQRDYAALAPSAISYSIEDAWREEAFFRSGTPWHCEIWPTAQMVIVALPTVNETSPRWFVANARTGAWAPFTNWDATCVEVFKERCFFGSRDGKVIEANVTGADQGSPFTAAYAPLFEDLGAPTALKLGGLVRTVFRGGIEPAPKFSLLGDFNTDLPSPPNAVPVDLGSVWDAGIWGQSVWGEERPRRTFQKWNSVARTAYTLSPTVQVTSGALSALDLEMVRTDLTYELADAIT